MKLQLKNLGAIHDVALEPKPLTIICGKNNTGKTYAMYSLWSLVELSFNVEFPQVKELSNTLNNEGEVSVNIFDFFEKNIQDMIDRINSILIKTLPKTFNTEYDFFDNTEMYLSVDTDEFLAFLKNDFNGNILSEELNGVFNTKYSIEHGFLKVSLESGNMYPPFIVSDYLNTLFSKIIVSEFGASAFLMPTERAGLNLFFNELKTQKKNIDEYVASRQFKENIEKDDIFDVINRRYYSLPIENYIDYMSSAKIDYDSGLNEVTKYINGSSSLMNSFKFKKVKGKVFFKTEEGKEFSLHLASSAIKTNLALWIYLSQSNFKNKLLMIDEPELNLHPDAQRFMARLIVYLVNCGVKIAVSTHSDYFIKEINSLIMLKNDFKEKEDIIKKYGFNNVDFIDSKNVIAYHFKDGKAELMPIDQNSGIQADTFDDVSNMLNEAYNDIFWSINSEF